MSCDDCPLKGLKIVPYEAGRNRDLLIVGESPGSTEVIEGKPFRGRSGKLLNECLATVGINRKDCHIANSTKCRMSREFKKSAKMVRKACASCREYLEEKIREVQPKAMLLLGGIALKQVFKQAKITSAHGLLQWSDEFNCWVMASYHPSYCLQFPQYKPFLVEDLTKLHTSMRNGFAMDQDQIETREVSCIDDVHGLKEAKYIAIDSETQGADPYDPNGLVISYSFAIDSRVGYQVFLHKETSNDSEPYDFDIDWDRKFGRARNHVKIHVRRCDRFDEKLELLRYILESDINKFMFNGNFDIVFFNHLFLRSGLEKPRLRNYVMDVQAAAQLLEENVYSMCSLEQVRKGMTSLNTDYSTKFDKLQDKADMLSANYDELATYAALDAVVTYHCGMAIRQRMNTGEEYENIFMDTKGYKQPIVDYMLKFTMPVLGAMRVLEENGARVITEDIEVRREEISREIVNASDAAIALIPDAIRKRHLNNNKQIDSGIRLSRLDLVRDTLFSPLGFGITAPTQTPSGANSIGREVRKQIRRESRKDVVIKFIDYYEQWAEYSVLLSRYIKQFEDCVRADGRIHPRYSIATTVTGRSSASRPSIQNFPKRSPSSKTIRSLVGAPQGHVLLAFDQAQAELRWAAQLSEDRNMIDAYMKGGDLHTKTAEALLGKNKSEVDPEEFKVARRSAKSANFGLLYGMGARKFREYARDKYDLELNLQDAEEYRDVFFRTYPGLLMYHKAVERFCHQHGYITSPFGRVRRVPEVYGFDQEIASRAIRQAINFPIQSASSDTVLLALVQMLEKDMLDSRLIRPIMFIHDDLTFECVDKPDVIDYYVRVIRGAMENPPIEEIFGLKMIVPLKCDAQVGYNLSEMTEYTEQGDG